MTVHGSTALEECYLSNIQSFSKIFRTLLDETFLLKHNLEDYYKISRRQQVTMGTVASVTV